MRRVRHTAMRPSKHRFSHIKAELDCLRARLEDLGMFVCVFLGV
jgi:hypothetical protein